MITVKNPDSIERNAIKPSHLKVGSLYDYFYDGDDVPVMGIVVKYQGGRVFVQLKGNEVNPLIEPHVWASSPLEDKDSFFHGKFYLSEKVIEIDNNGH
jgi:hypothetical protein